MVELIHGENKLVDQSKLADDILLTRQYLNKFISHNDNLPDITNAAYYRPAPRWRAECREGFSHISFYDAKGPRQIVEMRTEAKSTFERMLDLIDLFEKKYNSNNLKDGDFLPIIKVNPNDATWPYNIHTYRIPDSTHCDRCGVYIRWVQLVKHQKTEKCIESVKAKQRKDAKLVHTKIPKLVGLAKRGIIPHDKTATKWDWYVPTWVIESYELFEKNNGYAGMKFEEFIVRQQHKEEAK